MPKESAPLIVPSGDGNTWEVLCSGETVARIRRAVREGVNGFKGEMTEEFGGFKFRNFYVGEKGKSEIARRASLRFAKHKQRQNQPG